MSQKMFVNKEVIFGHIVTAMILVFHDIKMSFTNDSDIVHFFLRCIVLNFSVLQERVENFKLAYLEIGIKSELSQADSELY